jgi:mannose-6-phosphate isomerase-like protein (cupin superfamily)
MSRGLPDSHYCEVLGGASTTIAANAAAARRECPHISRRPQEGIVKKGFIENIEERTAANSDFRRVLYTAQHMQLVLMSLDAGEEIGEEVHEESDQFFRIETGAGEVSMSGITTAFEAGGAIVIPAGVQHNIRNTGRTPLQMYTLYAPPHHADGTVHATRADADAAEETFAGRTTE